MNRVFLLSLSFALVAGVLSCREQRVVDAPRASQTASEASQCVIELSELIDPEALDKIRRKRGATPRLREACYWLEMGRRNGEDVEAMIDQAYEYCSYPLGHRTRESKRSLVANVKILRELGCLGEQGMGKLRTGNAPMIAVGEFAEEIATVDHSIPRSICPELDNRIYNLRFMPESLNQKKSNKITERERELAREWHAMGLLSVDGVSSVEKHCPAN